MPEPETVLTGKDLWTWTDALTLPVRHRLVRENGATAHPEVPCLLDQLESDLGSTGGTSSRSKPGSRPPLNVTVLSLLWEIEGVLVDALVSDDLGRRDTLALSLRAVAAHVASTETPDAVDWWVRTVREWAGKVRACLPGEDGGNRHLPLRGMRCPECEMWTVERVDGRDRFRDAALVLVLNNRLVRHALCKACGKAWLRGEPLRVLAESALVS